MPENNLKAFINKVEQEPALKEQLTTGDSDFFQVANTAGFKITQSDAKGFFTEIKRITKEDRTEMPPLVVIIMAYLNMLFPESSEE